MQQALALLYNIPKRLKPSDTGAMSEAEAKWYKRAKEVHVRKGGRALGFVATVTRPFRRNFTHHAKVAAHKEEESAPEDEALPKLTPWDMPMLMARGGGHGLKRALTHVRAMIHMQAHPLVLLKRALASGKAHGEDDEASRVRVRVRVKVRVRVGVRARRTARTRKRTGLGL